MPTPRRRPETRLTQVHRQPVPGAEYPTAREAIQAALAQRPVAILLEGRNLVVAKAEAERMEAAGVRFAYLSEHNGRVVTVPVNPDASDIGDDFVITGTSRRAAGSGTWAHGKVAGHKFEALVFPEHAEQESFELDQSKISKLQIKRIADGAEVCSFDRGWDCEPVDATTRAVVEFLKGILADRVYG